MFETVIDRAKGAIDNVVMRLTARIAVAVPFAVAAGFATAGAAIWLTQQYGALTAYWVLAGFFAFVGVIAAAAVSAHAVEPDEVAQASAEAPAEPLTSAALPAFDPDLIFKAATRVGPIALPIILRLFSKNLPLIVGAVVLAYLVFSETGKPQPEPTAAPTPSL